MNTNRIFFVEVLIGFLLLVANPPIFCQDRSPAKGFQVGNSYSISDIENVNLTNSNLMLKIPLGTVRGRGTLPATGAYLTYDTKLWNSKQERRTDGTIFGQGEYMRELLESSEDGGWHIRTQYEMNLINRLDLEELGRCALGNPDDYNKNGFIYKMQITTPDGAVIEFRPGGFSDYNNSGYFAVDPTGRQILYGYGESLGVPACSYSDVQVTSTGMVYYSADGSGLRLEIPGGGWSNVPKWKLFFPDGRIVENLPADDSTTVQRTTDRNGNRFYVRGATVNGISGTKIENDFGQFVFVGNESNDEVKAIVPGYNGTLLQTTIHWKDYTVSRKYKATDAFTAPTLLKTEDRLWAFRFVDRITLPPQAGGLKYNFTYNAATTPPSVGDHTFGWGEVASVELPTGATAAYEYSGEFGFGQDPITLHNSDVTERGVRTRTLTYNSEYDGSSSPITETTRYNSGSTYGGSVLNPDGSSRGIQKSTNSTFYGFSFREESSDGTIDERIWAANAAPNLSGLNLNPYAKTTFHTIPDSAGSPSLTAIKDFDYDKNGNVLEVREYDWVSYSSIPRTGSGNNERPTGLPSSGLTLKRRTTNTYYYPTPIATDTTTNSSNHYANPSSPLIKNLIRSTEVKDGSGTTMSRSEFLYDGGTSITTNAPTNGNLTKTLTWDSTKATVSNPLSGSNSITTSATYNSFGMPLTSTDANSNVTQITYGNVSGPSGNVTDLYPTQTISAYGTAIARTSTAVYDFYTGLTTSATDADNGVTNATEYDALGRPTKAITAAGNTTYESWTTTTYNDAGRYVVVKSDLETKGDGKKVATQFYDQLGRVRLSKTLEDPSQSATNETDGIKVQTRYLTDYNSTSGIGHTYSLTSNPYRAATSSAASGETTMGWTLSTALNTGRHSEVETFGGAGLPTIFGGGNTSSTGKVQTDIDAERTLVTDQALKQRISRSNALGQLTDIWEITASDGSTAAVTFPGTSIATGYQTSYTYDTLNNLKTVSQGSQTRTFTYSSLSRLLTATNPELGTTATNGTISYAYDANGNLTSKTDPRGIVTAYTYDALNRVTQRAYTNEPSGSETLDVAYTYDNKTNAKGKLTKVSTGTGTNSSTTEYTAFDILGRVTASKQTTDGGDSGGYTTGYTYTLGGALDTETYPSGRIVKNVLNNDGTLELVEATKNSSSGFFTYANSFTYNPAGAVTSMQLGNNRWESTTFNSRLQPTQIALGTLSSGTGSTDTLKLNYDYGSTANNGNVQSQTITVPGMTYPLIQNYTYDSLNRLASATETSNTTQTWKQEFSYDRYGNRNFVTGTGHTDTLGTCTTMCNPAFDTTRNRITSSGYSYDSGGNTTADPSGRTFVYDAENKQTSVSNGSGSIGQYWYDGDGKRIKKYVPSTGETTVFVYDASGKLVAEYSTIVANSTDAKVSYLTSDTLGSPRINTDQNGAVIARHDYMPFGEEIDGTGGRTTGLNYGDDTVRKQFTGYQMDAETDLDFAQARMYSNGLARFTTVDPIFASRDRSFDPQGLNLYAYCRNSPLDNVDPDGKYYLGTDGRKVNVTVVGGRIKLGKNAPADLKRMAKLINRVGSTSAVTDFVRVADNITKTHFKIESRNAIDPGGTLGYHQPHDNQGNILEWSDSEKKFIGTPAYIKDSNGNVVYSEVTITIYEDAISDDLDGERDFYQDSDLTIEETMVAVNAHEDTHNTDQEGIDKLRYRQFGISNAPFNQEAAPMREEKKVHEEIKNHRRRKNITYNE